MFTMHWATLLVIVIAAMLWGYLLGYLEGRK
jgi:F420-0:gamma-glutamyl ligase-like protein